MAVPISNVTRRAVYAPSGAGGVGPYAFTFEILANTDIAVFKDDVLLTLTTHYTVSIAANGTGSVTITAAGLALAPVSPTQYAIVGNRTIARTTDFTTGGDFFANTVNDELDQQTIFAQQNAEGLQRALLAPQTDPTTIDMTLPKAADRANKTLAFDANGDPTLGISAADVANAVTYATNAANSATAAASSASSASSSASAASGSASTASTQASNASTSASNASTSASGASTSASNASSSASSASTSASNASTSATNAAASASTATTQATNAAASASSAASAQSAAEAARDSALAAYDNFDDRYLGAKSSDPALDNDGNALLAGALYYNTVVPEMRLYTGSAWVAAYVSGSGFLTTSNNLSELTATASAALTNLGGTTVGKAVFTSVSAAAAQQAMDVEVGVDVQAYDGASNRGLFRKTDPTIVAWTKTGAGTATTSSILYIEVNGALKTIASGTSISMPTLASGTDYAIWAKTDGTLQATTDHTSPPTANARKVGGFHYAHGGNATGTSGGNTTPAINEYSMWDLKWRPTAPDPRGMTLVGGGYWADIYLTGVDAITNGSSKYNVTMADGSSPPKVPTMFGGNGSTTYGTYTWFEAMELATAFGKRCPTQAEFMSLAYGTTEASSIGSDQGSTILNAAYTSKWGVMQAAGVLWVWGRDRAGPFASAAWNANTEGRGSEYNAPNSALFGGDWYYGANSGSRCSIWNNSASVSNGSIGSRFVCDHLQLD